MKVDLQGKVALITGSAGGIGACYAAALAANGAAVALADLDAGGATDRAEELAESGADAAGFAVDVADETSVAVLADTVMGRFGRIDIVVNNAALHLGEWSEGLNLPIEKWRRIMEVNVVGAVAVTGACRPHLARQGGCVVNQSSSAAYMLAAGAYGVSKLALNGVTTVLARELAPEGIRVNGIAPGFVESPAAVARVAPANRERVRTSQYIDRAGQMQDLVGALLFLVSDDAAFVTAQTISVDGGAARHP